MRNASNNIETKTNKTFVTNITRVRGIEPVIGREKKQASPLTRQMYTPKRQSESSMDLNEI